ncbi:MAG: STAS domain-containing protein [Ferruginibacter sp.]
MNVKTDTKERFTVITPLETNLTANMTAEMNQFFHAFLEKEIPHIVLNMEQTQMADTAFCTALAALQQHFYEQDASFVICCLPPAIEKILEEADLLDTMNVTPTESEAWDILQMEEVERELLNGELE